MSQLKQLASGLNRPLKLIVAGGRDFHQTMHFKIMCDYLTMLDLPQDTELVCGMARGADSVARQLWLESGNTVHEFPANWNEFGKSAGCRRNAEMAKFADALVAFWDSKSPGTNHMITEMRRLNKPTFVSHY